MDDRLYVIAGNRIEFLEFLKESRRDPRKTIYLYDNDQLKGLQLKRDQVIRVGHYWRSEVSERELESRFI